MKSGPGNWQEGSQVDCANWKRARTFHVSDSGLIAREMHVSPGSDLNKLFSVKGAFKEKLIAEVL